MSQTLLGHGPDRFGQAFSAAWWNVRADKLILLIMMICYRFGALPQWHLQGLHSGGRRRLVLFAMSSLQELLDSMPCDMTRATIDESRAAAAVAVSCLACDCSLQCFGYVASQLLESLREVQTPLLLHCDSAAQGVTHIWPSTAPMEHVGCSPPPWYEAVHARTASSWRHN